jgi:hypothetical protein
MLKNMGPRLVTVALHTGLVCARYFHFLGTVDVFAVRIVAVSAYDPPRFQRVMILETGPCVYSQMTMKTNFKVLIGVDDIGTAPSAGFHMAASSAVTAFTAKVFCF